MEAAYLSAEYSAAGSVLRGFEGHLSTKEALRRRPRGWKPEDRAFSLSSRTSPVTREIEDEQMAADLAAGGNKWRAPAKGKR
jgi:chromatin modification-related protein EAF6